jgi:glyoxalase-like protein
MPEKIYRRFFLALLGSSALFPSIVWPAEDVPTLLDHFILGCNDLDHGIDFVEQNTGVRAALGGVHPGRGTCNALLSLGERRYLEIMAPDPAQHVTPQIPRLLELKEPRIVGWAVHTNDLDQLARKAVVAGFAIEGPSDGSRSRPDGKVLRWRFFRLKGMEGTSLPFFIEWARGTVHPSVDAPSGCTLLRFTAHTTHAVGLKESFRRLGVGITVEPGKQEALRAQLAGPKGQALLSS